VTLKEKDDRIETLEASLNTIQFQTQTLQSTHQDLNDNIEQLENKLIKEYEDRILLKATIERLSLENQALVEEVQDFRDMMEEMKIVATESEQKDQVIQSLKEELEEAGDKVFCLEARGFSLEEEKNEMEGLVDELRVELEEALNKLEEFEKESKVSHFRLAGVNTTSHQRLRKDNPDSICYPN
jgi:chromosome segregation ATPase